MGDDLRVEYSTLGPDDVSAVDGLMKRNSQTLGFLPTEALNDYLRRGRVIGAKDEGDRLIAYLLYAPRQSSFRIVQLCVSQESRGQGIARKLLEELRGTATTQSAMTLNCRRDFSAHQMWPKLGFVAVERNQDGPKHDFLDNVAPHAETGQPIENGAVQGRGIR